MISFNFLNKNSYEDFGIKIKTRPSIPLAERRVTYTEIMGRSGSLTYDDNTYKDITIAVECYLVDKELINSIYDIKAWLSGGVGELIFSFDDERKYIAQVVNKIDIVQSFKILGSFTIIFNCQPFGYAIDNSIATLSASQGIINNIGTKESNPTIKIYGNGTIDLTINSETIHLTNVVDYITIDSDLMDCYKDTVLFNNNMSGDFPTLQVGTNTISWVGTVTKVEITPNWRYL